MMKHTLAVCLLLLASVYSEENKRDPKFFLVTSTTSTTLTTTISTLQTKTPCLFVDADIKLVACPRKKKRSILLDQNESSDITISKRDRRADASLPTEIQSAKEVTGSNRKAKFFLYYMTTTITSTSTSTSTSSSYTATYTISLVSCTPAGIHTLCG